MELISRLVNAFGPSGDEIAVQNIIKKEIKEYADKTWIDKFGNLIAHQKGKKPKVMLIAHTDEIGTMIKNITSEGKIELVTVGDIEPITLVGQKVYIFKNNKIILEGVISFSKLQTGNTIDSLPKIDDLYVDTGLDKNGLRKAGVEVGQYVIPHHRFTTLGNKKIVSGKALDNRLGCYVLIQAAKILKKAKLNVYYTFTVQEEVGLYGAKVSTYDINPEWGIAVDATTEIKDSPIGSGPYITIKDAGMLSNACLDEWLKNLAKKKKIPYLLEVSDIGTTDATNIMLSRRGVPTALISIPVRNLHSTVSIAHIDDVDNAIKLVCEFLKNPPKICLK